MKLRSLLVAFVLSSSFAGAACSDDGVLTAPRSNGTDDDDSDDDDGDDDSDDDFPGADGGRADAGGGLPAIDGGPTSDGGAQWSDLEGLEGAALKAALFDRIKGHTSLGYDGARDALLGRAEIDAINGKLECVYTGLQVSPDGTRVPNGFNTEHTWPQSQGAETEPARSDLHHLFAVEESINNARANHPFGKVSCLHGGGTACSYMAGGSALGTRAAGGTAFEVRPAKRGDVARAHFYFSVRYGIAIAADEEADLRAWNAEDVVDAWEVARNDAIEKKQKNRNPFVDRPDFVVKITDF